MISAVLAVSLVAIAGLHIYWGLGWFWPGHDAISLARTVAGFRNVSHMPSSLACFAVALALIVAALWPFLITGQIDVGMPRVLIVLGGVALTLIFLLRGIAAYLSAWRRLAPEQPFAKLDQVLYGPLCLILGGMFASVVFGGLAR